ncbi:uncharacterized protein [Linepithema humile]|uniref:uncharacterized protein n=1 Tax=Linepithema humile TaxID=83485 RepID=UPI00351ECE15
MNVTDKQKETLLEFMKIHPDFGRGRIRSKGESKKQLDQLWAQLAEKVNSSGCGPQKTSKEWAKTWRDWKSNVLKKVATYKSYATCTGGGPPKKLQTSRLEDDLLEFMSPDASRLSGIPEGGFGDNFEPLENASLSCLNTQPAISSRHEVEEIDWMSNSLSQESDNANEETMTRSYCDVSTKGLEVSGYPAPKKVIVEAATSHIQKFLGYPAPKKVIVEAATSHIQKLQGYPAPKKVIVEAATSHIQRQVQQSATPAQSQESLPRKKSVLGKRATNQTMISLLEKKTSTSKDFKTRALTIKEKKLELCKEEIALRKQHHQELMKFLGELKSSIDEFKNKINDTFGIQYLE